MSSSSIAGRLKKTEELNEPNGLTDLCHRVGDYFNYGGHLTASLSRGSHRKACAPPAGAIFPRTRLDPPGAVALLVSNTRRLTLPGHESERPRISRAFCSPSR